MKRSLLTATAAAALTFTAVGCSAHTHTPPLDARACYIDSTPGGVNPEDVVLRCGNGSEAKLTVDRSGDGSADVSVTAEDTELDGWEITNPQGAINTANGATVGEVFLKRGDDSCWYSRDFAKPAESTQVSCDSRGAQ